MEIEMKTVTTKIRLLTAVVKGERDIDKGLKTFEICDGAINSPEKRVRNSPEHLEGSRSSQFGPWSYHLGARIQRPALAQLLQIEK